MITRKGELQEPQITFKLVRTGGTGGEIFRKMYGDFLVEAAELLENSSIRALGLQFLTLSAQWDTIATDMWKLSQNGQNELLNQISKKITKLHDVEYDLLSKLAKECTMCLQKLP